MGGDNMKEGKTAPTPMTLLELTAEELKALMVEGAALRREIDRRVAPMVRLTADDFKLRSR
jgi:hypothetical protein